MKKLIVIFCVVILAGCGYNSTPQPIQSESISESQSESSEDDSIKLTDKEQLIFECLVIASSSFKNPSEMRLLEIGDETTIEKGNDYPNGSHYISVKLQGTNSMGGTKNNIYLLQLEDAIFKSKYKDTVLPDVFLSMGELRVWGYEISRKDTDINIKNINLSLKAFWDELGL